jgi:hypothetical protein
VVPGEEELGVLDHLPAQPHNQGVREEGGREELVHDGAGKEGSDVSDGTARRAPGGRGREGARGGGERVGRDDGCGCRGGRYEKEREQREDGWEWTKDERGKKEGGRTT